MRAYPLAVVLFGGLSLVAAAEEKQSDYEATVVSAQASVYSGPSRNYYSTGKLSRSARVHVIRHEIGGWCVITPPAGSFSWVRAEYVDASGKGRGSVNSNNVAVYVGSALNDLMEVKQKSLSIGDEVQILGEKSFPTESEPKRMYRIASPRGELRYMMGTDLQPVGNSLANNRNFAPITQSVPGSEFDPNSADAAQTNDGAPDEVPNPLGTTDPFGGSDLKKPPTSAPPKPKNDLNDEPFDEKNSPLVERPLVRTNEDDSYRNSVADDDGARNELNSLNDRFRALVEKDTNDWRMEDLNALETGYKRIQDGGGDVSLTSRAEYKLREVEHWRKIKQEVDEFAHLTSETTQRDAKLLAMQRKKEGGIADAAAKGPVPLRDNEPPVPAPPITSAAPGTPIMSGAMPPASGAAPRITGGMPPAQTLPQGARMYPPPGSTTQLASKVPHFDGAGIVQRATNPFPGSPRHVLLAPNGRILAYLEGQPGVNLDQYVGRAMGVIGARTRRQDLQADFISVKTLAPVRLKTSP